MFEDPLDDVGYPNTTTRRSGSRDGHSRPGGDPAVRQVGAVVVPRYGEPRARCTSAAQDEHRQRDLESRERCSRPGIRKLAGRRQPPRSAGGNANGPSGRRRFLVNPIARQPTLVLPKRSSQRAIRDGGSAPCDADADRVLSVDRFGRLLRARRDCPFDDGTHGAAATARRSPASRTQAGAGSRPEVAAQGAADPLIRHRGRPAPSRIRALRRSTPAFARSPVVSARPPGVGVT
jgi:hypothetical protein